MKYLIEDTTLTSIADAVRGKGGTTEPIMVSELATAITNLPSGGGSMNVPDSSLHLTGSIEHRFTADSWNWFLEQFGTQMTATEITSASQAFTYCNELEEIPFDIYFDANQSKHNQMIFNWSTKIKTVPYLYNFKPEALNGIFQQCVSLELIPDDYCDTWDFSYINNQTSAYSSACSNILNGCCKLESFPMKLYENGNPVSTYSSSIYYNGFGSCYSLSEILDIPFPHTDATWTSNAFSSFIDKCVRLSRLTFKTYEDGSPYVVNWKNQKLDITSNVGYASSSYERGQFIDKTRFTAETEVSNEEKYQALKNNPDWWSSDIAYCRYGHTSAVETINSLPDTSAYLASAGGTNTITFKKGSGSGNDDGGVMALTEEEIAVATARGWTVAYSSY